MIRSDLDERPREGPNERLMLDGECGVYVRILFSREVGDRSDCSISNDKIFKRYISHVNSCEDDVLEQAVFKFHILKTRALKLHRIETSRTLSVMTEDCAAAKARVDKFDVIKANRLKAYVLPMRVLHFEAVNDSAFDFEIFNGRIHQLDF